LAFALALPTAVLAYGNWTDPMLVGSLDNNEERSPRIAADNDGIPWVVWMAVGGEDWDIFYSRYIDGVWEERQLVHAENTSYDGYPQVAMGEDGKLWVLWQVNCGDDYCEVASHWLGQTFSEPDTVFRFGQYYDEYDIAVRDTNLVWATASMRDDGAGDRNLWFRKLENGVWGDVELYDRPGDDWTHSIALDDSDRPLVAWENGDRIWFMEMGDSSWTEPVEVIGRYSLVPHMGVDCYGRVWVVANRSPTNNEDVWYTYREDGAWSEQTLVNAECVNNFGTGPSLI
jgi:hypothetical protein